MNPSGERNLSQCAQVSSITPEATYTQNLFNALQHSAQPFAQTVRHIFSACALRRNLVLKQWMTQELWVPLLSLNLVPCFHTFPLNQETAHFYAQVIHHFNSDVVQVDFESMCIRPRWALYSSVLITNTAEDTTAAQVLGLLHRACAGVYLDHAVLSRHAVEIRRHEIDLRSYSILFNSPSAGVCAAYCLQTHSGSRNVVNAKAGVSILPTQFDYGQNIPFELEHMPPIARNDQIAALMHCHSFPNNFKSNTIVAG